MYTLFTLFIVAVVLSGSGFGAATSDSHNPGHNIAVCSISFSQCSSSTQTIPTEGDYQLALVSITDNSGLQQQVWDASSTVPDVYWIEKYLDSALGTLSKCSAGFVSDCWPTSAQKCVARPSVEGKFTTLEVNTGSGSGAGAATDSNRWYTMEQENKSKTEVKPMMQKKLTKPRKEDGSNAESVPLDDPNLYR
ncbi:uncharacterized protein MEPE_02906 [Melanopsichium pennsylvanicum]|uniref:Secreted protein n=1 Tax=Melanopsichium pennsylvanicum TaxID=63383 RepID=A0AAJ4XL95_9BASI|nr:uncharacterized protein MEPE_02906 [Melanopsichium pennsylvanicum]